MPHRAADDHGEPAIDSASSINNQLFGPFNTRATSVIVMVSQLAFILPPDGFPRFFFATLRVTLNMADEARMGG